MELVVKILQRAKALGIIRTAWITACIDLDKAIERFNLRLDEMLESDDLNFIHDFVGIQNNINRATGEFENCFLPRYSGEMTV